MPPRRDNRPPMVVAMAWVNRITSISLEMSLPPLGGYWLDRRFGTEPWLVVVGGVAGFGLAMFHLLRIVAEEDRKSGEDS